MADAYGCDVVAYPCMTLADGSTGYCHELSCNLVAPDAGSRGGDADEPAVDESAVDEHRPSFGVQGPDGAALHIPLASLVDVLEQMGATVTFDQRAFRQSAERHLVRAG